MKLIHRVSFATSRNIQHEFEALGIHCDVYHTMASFEIDESHPKWPQITSIIKKYNIFDWLHTEFTADELSSAQHLDVQPDWHHGYPQPDENNSGYLEATYDLSSYCPTCGQGTVQKAAFQMKGEPKWGRRQLLQLNWIFDEYFVTPGLWERVFKPFGVSCREVLNRRKIPLETVVQLVAEEQINVAVEGLPSEHCSICNRIKYLPIMRGYSPRISGTMIGHYARTKQQFGSGASSNSRTYLSQSLATALKEDGARGISLRAVLEDE